MNHPAQADEAKGMTDRELLEAAAKAAGIEIKPHPNSKISPHLIFASGGKNWNPLTDDGDALRLAVKLRMLVDPDGEVYDFATATPKDTGVVGYARHGSDPYAGIRRAIVRAAAALHPDGGNPR